MGGHSYWQCLCSLYEVTKFGATFGFNSQSTRSCESDAEICGMSGVLVIIF